MLDANWFKEPNRRNLINFLNEKIEEEVNQLAKTPSQDNLVYQTAISRANIAWYKALLHIANPDQYKLNPIGGRVKAPLTAKQYEEWRDETINRYTHSAPHPDSVTATYIHQIIYNGVHYGIK